MRVSKTALVSGLALAILAGPAVAQSDKWDKPIDVRPLLPPLRPFLPPNSLLTPGAVSTPSPSPYSSGPMYDSQPAQPLPGLRLTIPSR